MSDYHTRLGPLRISLRGDDLKLLEAIASEVEAECGLLLAPAALEMEIVAQGAFPGFEPKVYVAKGNLSFNSHEFFVAVNREFDYLARDLFNQDRPAYVKVRRKRRMQGGVHRRIWSGLRGLVTPGGSPPELVARSVMSYSLFWYLVHVLLMQKKATFIHAAIFTHNDKAIALTGSGGCGKTSTLFHILEEQDTKYLSEDFGILSENGDAYFNPKHVSLYHSDLTLGGALLQNFSEQYLTGLRKLQWQFNTIVLGRNPLIKVPPRKLLGAERLGSTAVLEQVIFMMRSGDEAFRLEEIDAASTAERAAMASCRELKYLSEILLQIGANSLQNFAFPAEREFYEAIESRYTKIFARTRNRLLRVPYGAGPKSIHEFLVEQGLFRG